MSDDYRRISVAVHGPWGSGKSWFADTLPAPRLIIDAEGGTEDTPSEKVYWNPMTEPIPEGDTVVVDVTQWSQIQQIMRVLVSGDHPFNSVIVDSITEIQKQLKDRISEGPGELFDQQAWGKLLDNMELFVRDLRNFTRRSAKRRVHIALVTGTDDERLPKKPMFQGGLRKSYASFFDVVGYLTTTPSSDGGVDRVMQIQPIENVVVAKCRLHNVSVAYPKGVIDNPTFQSFTDNL